MSPRSVRLELSVVALAHSASCSVKTARLASIAWVGVSPNRTDGVRLDTTASAKRSNRTSRQISVPQVSTVPKEQDSHVSVPAATTVVATSVRVKNALLEHSTRSWVPRTKKTASRAASGTIAKKDLHLRSSVLLAATPRALDVKQKLTVQSVKKVTTAIPARIR